MKIYGVTGKSGSGKSTYAKTLAEKLNCRHVDIDVIGRDALYQPEIFDTLCEKFGMEILDDNGMVDRKKVGNIVFKSQEKMDILIELTWNYMQQQIDKILQEEQDAIVLEYVLLPKSKYWDMSDTKILVKSDETMRKRKVIERDNISEEYFDKRDSTGMDYSSTQFDYILENDYKEDTMNDMLDNVIKETLKNRNIEEDMR